MMQPDRGTVDRGLWVGLAGLTAARIASCDPIVAVDQLPVASAHRELGAASTLGSRGREATSAL